MQPFLRIASNISDVTQRLNFFALGNLLDKIKEYRLLSLMTVIICSLQGRPELGRPLFLYITQIIDIFLLNITRT